MNHHRSCISKFHAGFDHIPAGSHPLVSQAVKSVFRLRPPLPKYVNTFDISIVFSFLQSLPANEDLDLKLLSYKTLFLLTSSTISRLSSLSRLGPDLRIFKVRFVMFPFAIFKSHYLQDHVVLSLSALEKQARPGHIRGYLQVHRFPEDPSLCPVAALTTYCDQVCRHVNWLNVS